MADEDVIWHNMCEQHIDKKCEKCGWGLALLDKRRPTKRRKTVIRRPWKDVYSERLRIERNWRNKKYNVLSLKGHTDGVMCLQFCEITRVIITGSNDKTVKVWCLDTGNLIRTLTGHTREVKTLQFDDAKLVTGAMDNALKIWNHHTGVCIRTLEGHTGGILSLHFDSRIMASGSTDHTIRVWNFDLGECCTLVGHTQPVNSVKICLDGKNLISSSDDTCINLWDLQSRTCIRTFQGHVNQVKIALPSPYSFQNLNIIISSSIDNTIKIWDRLSGTCQKTLFGHIHGICALDFDKLHIVSGSLDKTLRIWDYQSGNCLYSLHGHQGAVTALKVSDTKIISASDHGEVKLWDFGLINSC